MERLAIGKNGRRLETAQRLPVFLLADQVPGALVSAGPKDWAAYCVQRAKQGFNAVLFDPMPVDATSERLAELAAAADAAGLYVLVGAEGEAGALVQYGADAHTPIARLSDATCGIQPVREALAEGAALPVVALAAHESARFPGTTRRAQRADLWHAMLAGAVGGAVYSASELFDWSAPAAALQLAGAEDFAFAAQAVEYFDLTWGEAWDEMLALAARSAGAACGRTSSTALIYVPEPMPLELMGDFTETVAQVLDLTSGEGAKLEFALDETGHSHLSEHPFAEDALYVIRL